MRAVVQSEAGGPETLQIGTVDQPVPKSHEVLIKVAAAGLNRADVLQRQGFYPPPPGTSDTLGLEVSGEIVAVGGSVDDCVPGEQVCALLAGGGYAEYVAVDSQLIMPLPEGIDVISAAALPEVACTVHSNIVMTAHLTVGETILIHGGASGIGTHAIQVAKARGARVAVTAGTQEKLDACRDLGADVLINYAEQDFTKELPGADVIFDIIGAKYLQRNVSTLKSGGRLVIIGMQGGTQAELNIGELLTKRGTVAATNLRFRPLDGPGSKREIVAATTEATWPLIESGDVKPVVDRTFPLEQAAKAHRYFDSGAAIGKILLTV